MSNPRRRLKYLILNSIGPLLISGAMRLLRLTLRIEYRNEKSVYAISGKQKGIIFAFWHHDLIVATLTARHLKKHGAGRFVALASPSEDGELLARTVGWLGSEVVRGSSTRGARAGLAALERCLKEGKCTGIAVDGPLGPRHRAKVGAALIARESGAPIVPVAVRHARAWRVRSWDRTEIPKPFSRVVATFHDPITVPPDATREDLERVRTQLERVLLEAAPKGSD